jgi:hypothetical protein
MPPRRFWAKIQHRQKVRRPGLAKLQPGEAEVMVIRSQLFGRFEELNLLLNQAEFSYSMLV